MSRVAAVRTSSLALAVALVCAPAAAAWAAQASPSAAVDAAQLRGERNIGALETVFVFRDAMPTGVTVARNGRIFVNFPRWGDRVDYTVGEIRDGAVRAYPDARINRAHATDPARGFISVQSVVADDRDRLWVLDTAAPKFSVPQPGGAKLVAIDLASDRVVKTLVFPADSLRADSYVNDMRFDFSVGAQGVAYVTDSSLSGRGALLVMDLASGKTLRRLAGHVSTSADPDFAPIVEGQPMALRDADGGRKPFTVASDGIALSADGATLYYCALSSRRLYSVPTALLRDASVSEADLAAAVRDLGEKGASDGLEADAQGAIYAGDYEHNAIRKRHPDGRWETLLHDPRVLWPDTLSVGPDGYLYFTANQLHRQPAFHAGRDEREKPYALLRVRIDAAPAPMH